MVDIVDLYWLSWFIISFAARPWGLPGLATSVRASQDDDGDGDGDDDDDDDGDGDDYYVFYFYYYFFDIFLKPWKKP